MVNNIKTIKTKKCPESVRRAPSQFRCLRHSRSRRTQRPPGAARQQVASPTPALRASVMDDMVSEGDDSGCFLCRQCGEPIVDHKAMVVSGHLPFHADCYNAKRQLDGRSQRRRSFISVIFAMRGRQKKISFWRKLF